MAGRVVLSQNISKCTGDGDREEKMKKCASSGILYPKKTKLSAPGDL